MLQHAIICALVEVSLVAEAELVVEREPLVEPQFIAVLGFVAGVHLSVEAAEEELVMSKLRQDLFVVRELLAVLLLHLGVCGAEGGVYIKAGRLLWPANEEISRPACAGLHKLGAVSKHHVLVRDVVIHLGVAQIHAWLFMMRRVLFNDIIKQP